MSEGINTGGSAFPWKTHSEMSGPEFQAGMTLRDYFAAAALPRVLPDDDFSREWMRKQIGTGRYRDSRHVIAEEAYRIADAMLVEREKGSQ